MKKQHRCQFFKDSFQFFEDDIVSFLSISGISVFEHFEVGYLGGRTWIALATRSENFFSDLKTFFFLIDVLILTCSILIL